MDAITISREKYEAMVVQAELLLVHLRALAGEVGLESKPLSTPSMPEDVPTAKKVSKQQWTVS